MPDIAKRNPITLVKQVEKVVTKKVEKPISFDRFLRHLKYCGNCRNGFIDRGYVLITVEELKDHKLIPKRQPECYIWSYEVLRMFLVAKNLGS